MTLPSKDRKPSAKARTLSARLFAVQALYQSVQNKQRLNTVLTEFLDTRVGMEIEGETMVAPDGALFKNILEWVQERATDIEPLIDANIKKDNKDIGMLVKAVLTCATAELLMNPEHETGIIINDYVNVGHGFFDSGETGLINAILDAIAKAVRS